MYAALAAAYIAGLFYPLLEGDSSLHASMAMRMYLENDFIHLIKNDLPYLDKPHLHFWLAALAFKIGGVTDFMYRLPSFLMLILAAFSTFRLCDLLYENKTMSHLSTLIFLSAQTIVLSAHDVRTDAVLTGATAFALWQVLAFIKSGRFQNAIWAGIGLAAAFSSKGLLGVVVVGICIFFYLLASKQWAKFFNVKLLVLAAAFLVGVAPVLYAYYVQFDLNPEQIVEGRTNVSGIRFIIWDQSFNRFTASGFEQNSPSYSFFFHTLLWAFLPFSVILYFGVFQKTITNLKGKLTNINPADALLIGGFWGVMGIISLSKFKLPHYLNSLIPVVSILTASYLFHLVQSQNKRLIKGLTILQLTVVFLEIIIVFLILYFVFPISNYFAFILFSMALIYLIFRVINSKEVFFRLFFASVFFGGILNFFLNTQFYPNLNKYQVGDQLAPIIKAANVPETDIVVLQDNYSWKLDFLLKRNLPVVNEKELHSLGGKWLLINDENLPALQEKGISWNEKIAVEKFRITKLNLKFLNKSKRQDQLTKSSLIKLN